jgi:predicted amidohydrolase YtcJ
LVSDLVLINGKIVTVDGKESIAEAVAVKFGKIIAVGSTKDIKSLTGKQTKILDLKGRTVIPGLNDSHCHFASMSEGIPLAMGYIDASYEAGIRSLADITAKIAEQAKRKATGEWIMVMKEDESKLAEKRHPTKWDLDKVAPDHPVMIDTVGGHFAITNSKAFEMAGISKDSSDPMGGRFERDPKTGELTGWIHERARKVFMQRMMPREPTLEEAMNGLHWMANQYVAAGLTCAWDGYIASPILIRALQNLLNQGKLPLRIRMDIYYELMSHLAALGIGEGFGDDMLRICGIKVTCDGAISARTAWIADPYLHRPNYYGEPAITKEVLHDVVMQGYQQGYRFSLHANGERAINMALDVLEEAQEKFPRDDPRNRIIHCTVVTPEIIARIKKLRVLPTIFGPYPYYHGDKILPAFGADRLERMFAARSFLKEGLRVSAHSDHSASPYPPLMGIHALVNRKSANGQPIGISQRISVMEALRLYTINAAYHSFEEHVMGSIEPGKFADMVVLGKDILSVPTETIINIPIDMTIVDGEIVYERQG